MKSVSYDLLYHASAGMTRVGFCRVCKQIVKTPAPPRRKCKNGPPGSRDLVIPTISRAEVRESGYAGLTRGRVYAKIVLYIREIEARSVKSTAHHGCRIRDFTISDHRRAGKGRAPKRDFLRREVFAGRGEKILPAVAEMRSAIVL